MRSMPVRTTQLGAGWTKSPRPVLRGRSAAPQRRSGPLLTIQYVDSTVVNLVKLMCTDEDHSGEDDIEVARYAIGI